MKVKLLLFFVFFFVWISTSQAILFDRRPAKSSSLSYFIFPIAGSVPGVQTFYGITAQSQSIAKTNMGRETQASFYLLQGDANEHFAKQGDSRQFQGSFFDLANIPSFLVKLKNGQTISPLALQQGNSKILPLLLEKGA